MKNQNMLSYTEIDNMFDDLAYWDGKPLNINFCDLKCGKNRKICLGKNEKTKITTKQMMNNKSNDEHLNEVLKSKIVFSAHNIV
jgi:hypothetical protein